MNTNFPLWAAQIPWGPVAIVAVVGMVWIARSWVAKRKRSELRAKLAAGASVIDVRTKSEFQSRHYPGAVNIPLNNLASQSKKLGPLDRVIVVYCASGARSSQAAGLLRSAGFTNVTNAGGLGNMPR